MEDRKHFLPKTATLHSMPISGLAAESERMWQVGASFQYVFDEEMQSFLGCTLPSPQCKGHQTKTASLSGIQGFSVRVQNLHRNAERFLAAVQRVPHQALKALQNVADDGNALLQSQKAKTALPSQAAILPALNFASMTTVAGLQGKPLSSSDAEGHHHSNRARRRKAKKKSPCGICKDFKSPSSSSHSSDTPCSCSSAISFMSVASNTTQSSQDIDASGNQAAKRPSWEQLLAHPLASLSFIPKDTSLFIAGALAGATAKTITAPLDRLKLLLQVQDVNMKAGVASTTLPQAVSSIFKNEGVLGFWKGNVPQVVRILPYSAVQLFSYELFKKLFKGQAEELSVPGRLAAGACAGMISTLITFPLDTLRFKMAVEPDMRTMSQAAVTLFRNDGAAGFYRGLGPALLGIAPYIAINFCAYDLVKKAFPENQQKSPQVSFATAVIATTLATVTCYPLDTIRRQMQVTGCQYTSVFDAFPVIIKKHGVAGLYRGFVINALKNLPTSSIRLTTYQSAKELIAKSEQEWKALIAERQKGE